MANVTEVSIDEQRRRDLQSALARASPMALPGLLMRAEVQDREDSLAVFDKAVKEFGEGGVKTQFLDTAMRAGVNGVYVALAGAFGEKHKGAQHLGLESQSFYDDVVKFQYPEGLELSKTDGDEDEIRYQTGAVVQDAAYYRPNSQYNRSELVDKQRTDARSREIINDKRRTLEEFGKKLDKDDFDLDHIIPLKEVHTGFSGFADRYADGTGTLKEVANDPSNLEAADPHLNRSKGKKTNEKFVKNNPELTAKQKKKALEKSKMAENEMRLKLGQEGAKTVSKEQIGRLVILLMGPVYFEFKEWYATQKRNRGQTSLALGGRLKRMGDYVIHELPRILKEFAMDLGQMFTQLLKSLIVNFVAGLFKTAIALLKKLVGAVVDGFRIIVSAVKVLCDKKMSAAQKGDAIMKLLATFVVSVLGKLAMDALFALVKEGLKVPVPDWLASLITAFSTTIFTALALYGLDKLDLFAVKSEMRLRRITEIFEERKRLREERLKAFNVAATEGLRRQEEEWTKVKGAMDNALEKRNMDSMNGALDSLSLLFNVEIPYATPAEFVRYIRSNPRIQIA